MSTATEQPAPLFDRSRAQEAWLRTLPAAPHEALLTPRDLYRLLEWTEQCLRRPCVETLEVLGAEAYRLAAMLESRVGHAATLRYLRDGLAKALEPCVAASPGCADATLRVLCRVSDAVWEARSDVLQKTIVQQQGERLRQELMVAKRIQERLLPRTVPYIPGFDIAGRVLPAAEVGGDYWSCKNYPEDGIVTLKLADVTGHGIAAATLVAAVKFISGGYYRGSKTAAQVMERTNTVLVRETPHEILVTMVYVWLQPTSRELTIVNAGHSPVLHYASGNFRAIEPTGPALGLIDTRYSEAHVEMAPGDIFFCCSDGVTDPATPMALGEEWVRDLIAENSHLSSGALVERVLHEALQVYEWPPDDMSVLVVKCTE